MGRIDRIFRLHNLLAASRYPVPLERICDELECEARTAHRVIAVLRESLGARAVGVGFLGQGPSRGGDARTP